MISVFACALASINAAARREHLFGEQGRDGMRNGIVDVQQVQIVVVSHFRHARRQRKTIGRILEQRIVGHFHFVIVDARRTRVQPDGIGVGNEMDLMAARGQFQTEFGGDNAAAAVRGIAGDADLHSSGPHFISPAPICPCRF